MARLSKEFVKLETRILNDHRFFTMSEFEQLVFIKLLGISRSTSNQIPSKMGVIGELLRTKRSATDIKSAIKRIKLNFPKFKQNKYFYYFEDYELRLNNSAPKNTGMGCVDEDVDEDVDKDAIKTILCDLNSLLGSTYKTTTPKTVELIKTRMREGFTVENFKTVHRIKFKEWSKVKEMAKFLRPITLYSNKFESYLNQQESGEKESEAV